MRSKELTLNTAIEAPAPHDLTCTHDLGGRILSVNDAVCEALGLSSSTLCAMTIQQLLPSDAAAGFPDYMGRLTRDGIAIGTIRPATFRSVGRVWEFRSALDKKDARNPIVRGLARDVTQREESYETVRRSEEHFRSIIENVSDVIAIVELDGRIRYESPSVERVLGYQRKGLVGLRFLDLVHPEDASRVELFLAAQVADADAIQTIELRARHQAGTWRSFEIVAKNLVREGHATAIVMNARDITERKLLESQLAQAQRLGGLGRLAATVAHEFNNVLMGMQPFVELMQRPDATPSMIAKGTVHIGNSIQRGKRIVLDILRFSQPHVPVTAAVDVGEWWEAFAPEAEVVLGNMISVVSAIPRGTLHVVADRAQLSQVLANLVANARDAMPNGGTLTVDAEALKGDASFPFGVVPKPERFVRISVRDTGEGMSAEVMDRIFEPLFTTRQSGGTGLGLAVAHQVLAQHGGYLFVESSRGNGSTFHIFLRKAMAPLHVALSATATMCKPTARKLLMIEDEQSIVEGISALLEESGIEVQAIGSGLETARALARFRPDVVLLDYGLPGMDGSEVYALIRRIDASIPVIFASGHGDRRVLHDGLNDPRTRFLQKPFDVAALMEMLVDLDRPSAS